MGNLHNKNFPGESEEYRKARNLLLQKEIELRKNIESLAKLRRELPPGGKLKENYIFDEGISGSDGKLTLKKIEFSELFEKGKNSLIIYSFMFAPDANSPCPMCSSLLDGLNGNIPHLLASTNFVVIAKAPVKKIHEWAKSRGWDNLRILSSLNNSYNADYFAETSPSSQQPALNVFHQTEGEIFHFYSTELLFVPSEKGQNPRHVDLIWPLWQLLDMTPEGRGSDWYPKLFY